MDGGILRKGLHPFEISSWAAIVMVHKWMAQAKYAGCKGFESKVTERYYFQMRSTFPFLCKRRKTSSEPLQKSQIEAELISKHFYVTFHDTLLIMFNLSHCSTEESESNDSFINFVEFLNVNYAVG